MKTKYKNPRLKHVNKIKDLTKEIYSSMGLNASKSHFGKLILDQCNLLLKIKKKSLVDKMKCPVCGVIGHSNPQEAIDHQIGKPSPQLEIDTFSTFEIDDMEDGVDEALARKLNLVIDQVNKLTKTK